ncbi:ATP-dependent helicase HrpB [Xenorhabdus sp. Flor]|nr:ATP-dependent helicase HrpB [Xenorhabdus sp. Flor]
MLLPIYDVVDSVITQLETSKQVLLHAPTGAGKSTGLPLAILNNGRFSGRIIMLEPRRIAARSVAERLAEQLNEPVGMTVGYRMRSETKVSISTRLEVVTEGILTRMLQQDPELSGVSLVILDEFHERSLQADLALALLLDVQEGLRDDLRILVMSATLDNQRLSSLLPEVPIVVSEGRSYPVARSYHPLPAHLPFEQAVVSAVLRLLQQETGSLLLFLPGAAEIQRILVQLEGKVNNDTLLCPLYGALSLSEQRMAIMPAPAGMRKVVLATNIAETSLTIEGIRLVVDSGLERTNRFEPKSGLTRLLTQRISQASMIQRAGRAGRLEAGVCWHLFSQEQAERATEHSEPEILHSDLSNLLLSLLQWGCRDSSQLHWLDNPPQAALAVAQSLLTRLGALDDKQQLTARGWRMTESGCEPRLAAILCLAREWGSGKGSCAEKESAGEVLAEVLATAAKLVAILEEPPRWGPPDLIHYLISNQSHWQQRAKQLFRNLVRSLADNTVTDPDSINLEYVPELLVQGFPDRIAKNRDNLGRFQLTTGLGAVLEREESLSGETWLVAPVLQQDSKIPDARILLACPLNIEQIFRQYPALFTEQTAIEWDDNKGTLRAWKRLKCGRLTVKAQPLAKPSATELQEALLNWVRQEGLAALTWSQEASQLRIRLQRAAEWLPEIEWPAVDDDTLLDSLEQWLQPALEVERVQDLKGLRQVELSSALVTLLDWQQRQILDNELPTNYTVPTGSRINIEYFYDKPPVLPVRMQEMYGEQQNPVLAKGRIPVVVELLSPAHRPLQITQDLAAFWRGAYREVQKEMKGRYPKHLWPDDPANTAPTRRAKKYM